MTRYFNPAEIIPDIPIPNSSVIYSDLDSESSLDEDLSEWESRMEKLVGLDRDSPQENEPKSLIFEDENDLHPVLESPELEETPTKQPLSSNPFTKLVLVGGMTLVIFFLAGGFLWQIMNLGTQKPKKNIIAPPSPQLQEKIVSRLENLETEVETLKTKLAFAEQEQAIKNAQQTLRTKPTPKITPTVISPQTVSTPQTPKIQTVYVPQIVTVERVVKVRESAPPVTAPTPHPSPVRSPVVSQVPPTPQIFPEPVNTPPVTPVIEPPQEIPENLNPEPSSISQTLPETPKLIPVGTSVKGILATAVFGETSQSEGANNNKEPNLFVVTLQEPLKTLKGEEVLPVNTQLLTEITYLSQKGLLYLNVTKILWENEGKVREKTVSRNVLGIRSPQGKPLFAQGYPPSSGTITSMDMGLFILGGVGKVTQLFNRTDSEITTNAGGTVITSNNNDPNFVAGALEGGLNTIVPQIAQRNQQAIAELLQRSNIWFLPAGTKVEVYFNQALEF